MEKKKMGRELKLGGEVGTQKGSIPLYGAPTLSGAPPPLPLPFPVPVRHHLHGAPTAPKQCGRGWGVRRARCEGFEGTARQRRRGG